VRTRIYEGMVARRVPEASWPRLGLATMLALSAALFLGIFALRAADSNVGDGEGILLVLPVAALALRFGLRGGLAGALLAFALLLALRLDHDRLQLTLAGYADRGVAFLALGALLGVFVDRRRRLEAEVVRYFDVSLDLLATIDRHGRFLRVNPAWQRVLGHPVESLRSRQLIELVHRDERAATRAELCAVAAGSRDCVGFRNRCRTVDGTYRWLEWNASASSAHGVIHAVARDITVQRRTQQQLADSARWLETKIAERTYELDDARAEMLQLLAVAVEYRDDETFEHTERVGVISAEIAARLGLRSEQIKRIREAAPLHDVGKIAISDRILLKRGSLSADELNVMRTHAGLGARLLSRSSSPVLQMAAVIAATHHEWWDGSGYPSGLAGERIPLVGRVVAVADVFDALTHARPYKPAWPVSRAIARIQRASGSQFDPDVVAAFLDVHRHALATARGRSARQQAIHDARAAAPEPLILSS
jgi:PAS domain S-box-containing protein